MSPNLQILHKVDPRRTNPLEIAHKPLLTETHVTHVHGTQTDFDHEENR
jgi:hypothetical protein